MTKNRHVRDKFETNNATKREKMKWNYKQAECPTCKGSGRRGNRQCGLCHGQTWIWVIPLDIAAVAMLAYERSYDESGMGQ